MHELLKAKTTAYTVSDTTTLDDIKLYIELIHCGKHRMGAVEKFNGWRVDEMQRIMSLSSVPGTSDRWGGTDRDPSFDLSSESSFSDQFTSETGEEQEESLMEIPSQPSLDGNIARGLALMADASKEADESGLQTQPSNGAVVNSTDFQVIGLGLATSTGLWRRVSKRDNSPLSQELYKPLTPQQLKPGIVYILQHERMNDLWKVGWSEQAAEVRWRQNNNCYGVNTRVVYETPGGPFESAFKAEKLAHAYLRQRNLHIKRCDRCGKGHREWFQGAWEEIYSAVSIMEGLIKLPGYEYEPVKGEMKLSAAVHSIIDGSWKTSMRDLQSLIDRTAQLGKPDGAGATRPASFNTDTDTDTGTKQEEIKVAQEPTTLDIIPETEVKTNDEIRETINSLQVLTMSDEMKKGPGIDFQTKNRVRVSARSVSSPELPKVVTASHQASKHRDLTHTEDSVVTSDTTMDSFSSPSGDSRTDLKSPLETSETQPMDESFMSSKTSEPKTKEIFSAFSNTLVAMAAMVDRVGERVSRKAEEKKERRTSGRRSSGRRGFLSSLNYRE